MRLQCVIPAPVYITSSKCRHKLNIFTPFLRIDLEDLSVGGELPQ